MTTIEDAKRVLGKAEDSLRKLVGEAASNGEYDAVLVLADWAKTLNELVTAPGHSSRDPVTTTHQGSNGSTHDTSKNIGPKSRDKRYPHFYRNRDSLIKVAWSKSEKAEYEHRAPWTVAKQLAAALVRASAKNPLISMEQMFPLKDHDGEEIPSYQSYLCLAWLRDLGLLRQHGRRGYSIKPDCKFEADVATAWETLLIRNKMPTSQRG